MAPTLRCQTLVHWLVIHVGHGGQECPSYMLHGLGKVVALPDWTRRPEDEWEDEVVVTQWMKAEGMSVSLTEWEIWRSTS